MNTNGKFYLGRIYDAQSGLTSQPLLYDPADLTTHAVVVGMTGSGKTGLCLDMLEEAALNGIPALMIDPKGDITNALLHFPDLAPQDFQPWVNPDQARREGKTVEQLATETASAWKQGLSDWDIPPERLLALKNAAHFAIYTPGSDAGLSVSILSSLKAPTIPWDANRELLREKITGTVTALLGLVGMDDIDPVRSREHILLSNIFENAWSHGQDLDLGELILQTQTPPFPKLGVFDVNTFFPEKDRFALAMMLNNILAAPAFQTWIEGEPLDIASLLYAPDGRPRHTVFYIAHLSDSERMFFVSLLFSAVETWMRSQTGTSALRALVYFDEIYGYLPPVSNPPSKTTMLRMLKQARAFGVGMVLVTQNPVDLDYKALSNAGTWFIGKLQTEQDKNRLLDGLESALVGGLDRGEFDRLISSLGKRVFLLNNVNEKNPQLFQTRWVMNYLAGPLTRIQIPALNQLVGAVPTLAVPAAQPAPTSSEPSAASTPSAGPGVSPLSSSAVLPPAPAAPGTAGTPAAVTPAATTPALDEFQSVPVAPTVVQTAVSAGSAQSTLPQPAPEVKKPVSAGSTTRPTVPASVAEYFLPNNLTFTQAFKAAGRAFPDEAFSQGLIYHPVILGQASIRFLNRKFNLDFEIQKAVLVPDPDRRGAVRWEDHASNPVDPKSLDQGPVPQALFAVLETPFSDVRTMTSMQKDFLDWVYRTAQATVRAQETLGLYAPPNVSQAEFRKICADTARSGRDAEAQKTTDALDKKIEALRFKLSQEQRKASEDETQLSQRRMEELGTHAENILGLFQKRHRRLTSSLTKHRLTEQAKAEMDQTNADVAEMQQQLNELQQQRAQALAEITERWGRLANDITDIPITPLKKDVLLDLFGVAWMPYHRAKIGDQVEELPGFGTG